MSVEVSLQVNNSPTNKIGKIITTHATVGADLKENTSIIRPVLVMASSDLLSLINYVTIPVFQRSYFVENIVSVATNIVEVHCTVDPLESFKSQILAQTAVVVRQESQFNQMLDDGQFKAQQNPQFQTLVFPSGFSGSSYILAVAGR